MWAHSQSGPPRTTDLLKQVQALAVVKKRKVQVAPEFEMKERMAG